MTPLVALSLPRTLRDMAKNLDELLRKIARSGEDVRKDYPAIRQVSVAFEQIDAVFQAAAKKGTITPQQQQSIARHLRASADAIEKGVRPSGKSTKG
ncbi:MAG TPA: hypothetical protein VHK65_16310 [Candidatus Dormibacteraeota bacterium]|nr:hypothetical protein [Candidatus Dormibacteraeota bacterium]